MSTRQIPTPIAFAQEPEDGCAHHGRTKLRRVTIHRQGVDEAQGAAELLVQGGASLGSEGRRLGQASLHLSGQQVAPSGELIGGDGKPGLVGQTRGGRRGNRVASVRHHEGEADAAGVTEGPPPGGVHTQRVRASGLEQARAPPGRTHALVDKLDDAQQRGQQCAEPQGQDEDVSPRDAGLHEGGTGQAEGLDALPHGIIGRAVEVDGRLPRRAHPFVRLARDLVLLGRGDVCCRELHDHPTGPDAVVASSGDLLEGAHLGCPGDVGDVGGVGRVHRRPSTSRGCVSPMSASVRDRQLAARRARSSRPDMVSV